MVYIFFLFDTVKPLVNSQGWFICFKNSEQHAVLIGDKRLPETLFFLCVWWNQLLPLQLNPLLLPVSVSDTLFGFMPKHQSAATPPDFLLMALIFKTGCRLGEGCVFTALSQISAVPNLISHSIAQVSLLSICTNAKTNNDDTFLHMCALFARTIPWGQTHDQQMGAGCFGWMACLWVGARVLFVSPWICN